MADLPPGVVRYDEAAAKTAAATNFIALVYGGYKTGKTHFATRCKRPLYLVYLDRNPNIHTHLINSNRQWGDEVYELIIRPPKKYGDLTKEAAADILKKIDDFADWARQHAAERVAKGEYGGTFVLDGGTFFKGYCEKAILGESSTLGYRPAKGERSGITTYDYAKSNAAIVEFIGSFLGASMDACFVFEGRPMYKKVYEEGREVSRKTDAWRSTRPDAVPYAVNAEVETLKVIERTDPTNNQSQQVVKPKIRIVFNSENFAFDNKVLDAKTFDQFKELLLVATVGVEALRTARPVHEVVRANDSGMPGGEDE